jgi:hypothetical protein
MKLQKFNRTLLGALLVSGALGVVSQAHALNLTPASLPAWYSTSLSNLTQSEVEGIVGVAPLGLVYKQDFGGLESGNGAGYYTTSFVTDATNSPLDPLDASGATITWDGPVMKISCGSCFLVVKDGNHDASNPPPYPQYIFNISGWNGTDTINLSGFWPGPGAISNIAIWNIAEEGGGGGGTITPVPEADTYAMLLAGLGLVGFAARRKLRKPV